MKILVCVAHFYDLSRSEHAVLGSSQDSPEKRAETVDYCLKRILSIIQPKQFLLGTSSAEIGTIVNADVSSVLNDDSGDLHVCTHGENHLLDRVSAKGYIHHRTSGAGPKLLSYECRRVFVANINKYDLFYFTEDDITPLDAAFFRKIGTFYNKFGVSKIVLPQRFELFGHVAAKAYLEHPTPPSYRITPDFQGENRLSLPSFDGDVWFEKTTNQAAGCYAITREHLLAWMKQPYFLEPSPHVNMMTIEQGQIPMLGRYPIYKTSVENLDFLEVHHVPNRASHAKTPSRKIVDILLGRA